MPANSGLTTDQQGQKYLQALKPPLSFMKTPFFPLPGCKILAACGLLTAAFWSYPSSALDVIAPLGSPTAEAAKSIPSYSPGVADVVKMLDAKVDPAVVKAYINSSPTSYNPTADEIVALKEHGVPDDVVTTLLERGAEVRNQGPQHVSQNPPPS